MPVLMAVLTVGTLGVSGCSQDEPSGVAPTERTTQADPTQDADGTVEDAAQQGPDPVCDSVETLFSHMRSQSVSWRPRLDPSDARVVSAVRTLAQGLADKGLEAGTQAVSVEVSATVEALNRLAVAMESKQDAPEVISALRSMKVAYSALTAACDPDSTSSAASTATTQPHPASPAPTSERNRLGQPCRSVQRVMVEVGTDLAAWSPREDPFDETTAATWQAFGDQLAGLAPQAETADVRTAIKQNATAFNGIADAMRSRSRGAVNRSIKQAGLAYLDLHEECSLP